MKTGEAAWRFGVSETDIITRVNTLISLRNVYPAIINALNRKRHLESELARRKADITAPELTLTEKPPYTLKYYDAYIDQLADLMEQIDDAQYDFDHADADVKQTQKRISDCEAAWRLARDNFTKENTPQTIWHLNSASFLLERERAFNVVSVLKRENMSMILTARKLARDRHARVRTYIREHLDLTEKSFESQKAELGIRVNELEAMRAGLNQQYKKAQDDWEAAQVEYASARDEARVVALIKRDMYDDERERLRLEVYHLQSQLVLLAVRMREWTLRYDIARGAVNIASFRTIVDRLKTEGQTLDEQLSVLQKDMLSLQSRLAAVQKQIEDGVTDSGVLEMLRRDRASLQAAIDTSLAHAARLFSVKGQTRALIDEFEEKYQTVSPWEKLGIWWQKQGSGMLNTELWQSGGYAVRLREFLFALALVVLGSWGARRAFIMLLWLVGKKVSILKEKAHEQGVTVTAYLAAVMAEAVGEKQKAEGRTGRKARPVKITIPVNLRRTFGMKTMRNFTLAVNIGFDPRLGEYSHEEICALMGHLLAAETIPQRMAGRVAKNVDLQNILLLRLIPLFIKRICMRTVYALSGENKGCLNISNMGVVTVPEAMEPLVERFEFIIGVQYSYPNNCSVVTYHGKTYISMIRGIRETELERLFFARLVELGIPVGIESN